MYEVIISVEKLGKPNIYVCEGFVNKSNVN